MILATGILRQFQERQIEQEREGRADKDKKEEREEKDAGETQAIRTRASKPDLGESYAGGSP
jgi:hypothetical protein